LRQALEAEAQGDDAAEQAAWSTLPVHGLARHAEQDETSIHPLTRPEQERCLRALEKLERLDRQLLERGGTDGLSPPPGGCSTRRAKSGRARCYVNRDRPRNLADRLPSVRPISGVRTKGFCAPTSHETQETAVVGTHVAARPTSSPLRPTLYTSAVSSKLIPRATARWTLAIISASSRPPQESGHARAAKSQRRYVCPSQSRRTAWPDGGGVGGCDLTRRAEGSMLR
jgi:hypothetical protein